LDRYHCLLFYLHKTCLMRLNAELNYQATGNFELCGLSGITEHWMYLKIYFICMIKKVIRH